MSSNEFSDLYKRDILKFIEEIELFKNEDNLWRTCGEIKNSSGNLALHIIGGLNYLIGATLLKSSYVRNRDKEFSDAGIDRRLIVKQLKELTPMIEDTLQLMTSEKLNAEYPIFFDKVGATNSYVLTQLLIHLNYHLGQVNYLRRVLD